MTKLDESELDDIEEARGPVARLSAEGTNKPEKEIAMRKDGPPEHCPECGTRLLMGLGVCHKCKWIWVPPKREKFLCPQCGQRRMSNPDSDMCFHCADREHMPA